MSTHPTPDICTSFIPLPVIGGRAYGVSARGCVVSFHPREGWTVTESAIPQWTNLYVGTSLLSVGRYLLITQPSTNIHHNKVYHWWAYDTISGEVTECPEQAFGGNEGMFTPALAVLEHPNTIHYIDPKLVYPHPDMRWGIISPGSVVVVDEG
ncbi:hypothetical protein KIPB_010519 [Kipferlia bialata]|uniref:Uncharacterized protein n=1 Tax=Kipferlia bialata TaxID=797122 RepID=A0A391NWK7_9EUKA|nr:hypothetical protein KIPB_010519 [Kipferlia bialata]|eukprot:g10519.t1